MGSLLRVHPRYMRSVQLERDFVDPSSSLGYVVTPVARNACLRICAGFQSNSTQRAFRISGDYGSGKSAFGLALARVAAGYLRSLPKDLRSLCGRSRLLPLLATGDHEPLGVTVLRAAGIRSHHRARPTTTEVLGAVKKASGKARSKGFKGVLLILDELGKNLEFAAQNPEADDIFLLQRLGEEAARSGDQPLVVVVMLHQGVAAYSAGLGTTARREWDKVAGRFEEIIYAQPLEQLTTLVAATLNVNTHALPRSVSEESKRAMAAAVRCGIYGSSTASDFSHLGSRIFPIHPTVLPVLVRAIRKFGQNERSLFSFLSASEPMGLQHHVEQKRTQLEPYRLSDLFEYVRQNLMPSISTGSAYIYWGFVESMLSSTPFGRPEEEIVFKGVALLTLLDAPDLPATEEFLRLAFEGQISNKAVSHVVDEMKRRGVLYERGTARGLCLWSHTSVNLDEVFERGTVATRTEGDTVDLLCKQLPPEQIVPRGHYFRSGTLRYGEVQFVPASALSQLLAKQPELTGKGPDLNLRVIIPANQVQARDAERELKTQREGLKEGLFIAVASPPTMSGPALADLLAWKWVLAHIPELANDRYAREEVVRQTMRAERTFRDRLAGLDNLELPIAAPMTWFSATSEDLLKPGRNLLTFLGEQCDRIYKKAPRVLNELINRRSPSSAAVAARSKLAEAMTSSPHLPKLGMDDTKRPPEMALYLSVLQEGGFHVQTESGWGFRLPTVKNDACKLLPSLHHITSILQADGMDALVPVPQVFEALSKTPYGVREGLQPFILAVYLATHHQRVAFYEDGTYLPEVGGEVFLRLMKEPQFFHIQYCELEGVRSDVFARLLQLLKIHPRDAETTDLIDLLRPLTVFISREVPEYARKTNTLSAAAVAVRRALLEAKEPVKLVFTMLPEACGLPPINDEGPKSADDLASRLRAALHEIRAAYPKLIKRLEDAILAAFDIEKGSPLGRGLIADRAAQLSAAITEPGLRAFAIRLADSMLDERAWVESVANLLARKSPERWLDNDEAEFHHQLEISAGRFKRTELVLIGTTKKLNGHACRIALTKSDGSEVGDLINWDGMDENRIRPVEGEIREILSKHGRHGLAAAMRAIWTELHPDDKQKES
jgi:hypothetical protein